MKIRAKIGKSEVEYDSVTGLFIWVKACKKPWLTGKPATHAMSNGYLYIKANGSENSASRLAYQLFFKTAPGDLQIDHINRNRQDNRPDNLRLVTPRQQLRNRAFRPNRCGVTGVSFHREMKLYRARYANKTTYHKTLAEAALGYKKLFDEPPVDNTL